MKTPGQILTPSKWPCAYLVGKRCHPHLCRPSRWSNHARRTTCRNEETQPTTKRAVSHSIQFDPMFEEVLPGTRAGCWLNSPPRKIPDKLVPIMHNTLSGYKKTFNIICLYKVIGEPQNIGLPLPLHHSQTLNHISTFLVDFLRGLLPDGGRCTGNLMLGNRAKSTELYGPTEHINILNLVFISVSLGGKCPSTIAATERPWT